MPFTRDRRSVGKTVFLRFLSQPVRAVRRSTFVKSLRFRVSPRARYKAAAFGAIAKHTKFVPGG